jgi:PAS domain S-box-containing protein
MARDAAGSPDPFFDASNDLLAVLGFDLSFERVNPTWTTVLGWSDDDLLDMNAVELFHPADVDRNVGAWKAAIETHREVVNLETRLRSKDETFRWVLVSARADHSADRLYVVVKDVHDRHLVEEQLRFEMELDQVVTHVSTRLLAVSGDELWVTIRAALRDLAGVFEVDRATIVLLGDRFELLAVEDWTAPGIEAPPTDPAAFPIDVRRWWVGRMTSGALVAIRSVDDGADEQPAVAAALLERNIRSLVAAPILVNRRAAGFVALMTFRDERSFSAHAVGMLRVVGEACMHAVARQRVDDALKDATKELARRNIELERSNDQLQQFAYVASHDLQSPLVVVHGYLELLERLKQDILDDEAQSFLAAAQRGVDRMQRLIEALLEYSRVGERTAPLDEVDLDAVLDEVLADLAPLIAEAGAHIERGTLPTVTGNRTGLERVVQNLLSNAVKFRRPAAEPNIAVAAELDGDGWRISVADDGIGIPDADRNKVFGMFSRLHGTSSYPGTGIGLAICEKVVEAHGGRIWVEPRREGPGSRFVFTLPGSYST